jgi:energy-converting hydrogenase Eha subunit A
MALQGVPYIYDISRLRVNTVSLTISSIRYLILQLGLLIFQIMMKERPTKRIFKANHIFRISILLIHISALHERHLQGAQRILMKLCVCNVISAAY